MKLSTPQSDNRETVKIYAQKPEHTFLSEEDRNIKYVTNVSDYGSQIRITNKKKRKYSSAGQMFLQNILTGFIVFVSIVLALAFAFFVFVQPIINNMLKNWSGGTITEMLTLFNEVQTSVGETDMTDSDKILINSQQVPVYLEAVNYAKQAGLDVFNEADGIEPGLATADLDFDPIYLSDIEVCAIFNRMINQIATSINNDILNYLDTNFRIWQIKLYRDEINIRINVVIELNLDQFKAKVGTSNIFIPTRTFVVWDAKTTVESDITSDNYGNLAFSDAKITINKLSSRSLEILFNMLKSGVPNSTNLDITPDSVSSAFGDIVEDGISFVTDVLDANLIVVSSPSEELWFCLYK